MVNPALDPSDPLAPDFRAAVGKRIAAFLEQQADVLAPIGAELGALQTIAADLLSGGKRLRPGCCVWGFVAAAGLPTAEQWGPLLGAAASLDVLHVSALVHDDVMDGSDTRRGRPAAHRQLETQHAEAGWLGDRDAFGRAGAILLGDLLVMWSVEMLQTAGLDAAALARARPLAEAMRTEVTCGQFLDIVSQVRPLDDGDRALADANRVVEFKSARYTVQRPLQIGAAIGGAGPELIGALADYGSPLGRAFQFRDDLLGVFGDPAVTGKPAGDDLREGKRTVLIAYALTHANRAGRDLLTSRLGDPGLDATGVLDLQGVLEESGSRDAVEAMIEEGYERALAALDGAELTDRGRAGLTALARVAVQRTF